MAFTPHVAELNATDNAPVRSYVWAFDLSQTVDGAGDVGGLLWLTVHSGAAAGTHFCAYDCNGNLVSPSTATETARYEYGPFGELLRATGLLAAANLFRFSTKYQDAETDLLYYGYRYYSPTLGRWLSRDPIDLAEYPKVGMSWLRELANAVHFLRNDPVDLWDVLGLRVNDWPVVTIPIAALQCTSNCGPDYTKSLNSEIARLRQHLAGLPRLPGPVVRASLIGPNDGGMTAQISKHLIRFYIWFARLALSFNYDDQARANVQGAPLTGCPTVKCWNTITLCGRCVTDDTPGNLLYGFAAAATGVASFLRDLGAHIAEFLDGDAEWPFDEDTDVFPLGEALFQSGANDVCTVVGSLPGHTYRADCTVCRQTGRFNPVRFPAPPRNIQP